MDYGQTNQTDVNSADFFTAGAGTQDELVNNVNPENNFDLSNSNASWNAANARYQSRNFGQNAIRGNGVQAPGSSGNFAGPSTPENMVNATGNAANHPEATTDFSAQPPETGPDFGMPAPEFGQITDLEQPAPKTENAPASDFYYDSTVIRIDGDTLSSKAIEVLAKNEKNFGKTGDAASFVENFEQAKIDNLKNSYNREFGG